MIDAEDNIEYSEEAPTKAHESSLTDWANEPSVSDLKQDASDAESDRQIHVQKVDAWLDNLNVTGSAKHKKVEGKSSIVPKVIRKQAEWRYASLSEPFLSTDDIFNTAPVSHEDKDGAIQNGMVLNNQFNTKIDKVSFIDEYIRTAVDEGTVFVKVGWEYEDEEVEVEVPTFEYRQSQNPQIAQAHQQIHQLMETDPQAYKTQVPPEMQQAHELTMQNGFPIEPVQTGTTMETQTKVIKNQPALEVCNYKNLSIDPTAKGDLSKAGFIRYSFESSLSELEKAGSYKNLDKINVENNSILSEPDHVTEDDSSFNFSDKPRKKFVVFEYWGSWDINDDGSVVPIVAAYVGDVMVRLEENPFPDQELPFISAQYLPVRKSVYGEPDGELLEENQKIIGATVRGMVDTMARSANGQVAHQKGALDTTNLRKFNKGMDYEFNAGTDPRTAFHMHTYPEIPQSAQYMLGMQSADAEGLSGVRPFAQSQTGNVGSESATGVKTAMDATAIREMGILRRLASGIKQIGRKIISMNAEFLSEEEVVRLTNDEFVTVRRDDLAGNYDLRLSISTPEADNAKAEELAFMMQTTAQSMEPAFTQLILSDIARLRKMPDLAKKIEEFQPPPDPMEEMIKKLEVQKLQVEIEEIKSKTAENYAEANLDGAKAVTEGAKASNLGSDTDLKNLDFMEQESGVHHARDMQQNGAQAEANKELKMLDHAMKKSLAKDTTTTNGVKSV